jgi:hypothetical protein
MLPVLRVPYASGICLALCDCGVCCAGHRAGLACQRQHWTSHKRECHIMAAQEFLSTFGDLKEGGLIKIINNPGPSDLPLLPKLSAITWTNRVGDMHFGSLHGRGILLDKGCPLPGDTKETLNRLLKRAATELPWPELPGDTRRLFMVQMTALAMIARFGEPEAALEILNHHVKDVDGRIIVPKYVAMYYLYRLDWLLATAVRVEEGDGNRGAYVAEAKGLMERLRRSLRDLQPEDWTAEVSYSTSPSTSDRLGA